MNNKKLDINMQKRLIKDYTSLHYSIRGLMNKYKIGSTATLYRYLKNNCNYVGSYNRKNVSRKHIFNYHFFNEINTEEKAYWLGFLYADGNVSFSRNAVSLRLCEKDKTHLEKFRQAIDSTSIPISPYVRTNFVIKGYFYDKNISYNISVNSVDMVKDLCNKGCIPRKSLILKFPTTEQVPSLLVNHFIRGYMDGDGHITKSKHKLWDRLNYSVGFCGTYLFLSRLLEIIKTNCGDDIKLNVLKEKNRNLYTLKFGGNKKVGKILSFLYKDSNIFLDRKYQIYQNFLTLENRHCGEDNDYRAMICKFKDNNGKIIKFSNLRKFCRDNPEYRKSRSRLMDLYHGKILSYKGLTKI